MDTNQLLEEVKAAPATTLKAKLLPDTLHKLRVVSSFQGMTQQLVLGLIITAGVHKLWTEEIEEHAARSV